MNPIKALRKLALEVAQDPVRELRKVASFLLKAALDREIVKGLMQYLTDEWVDIDSLQMKDKAFRNAIGVVMTANALSRKGIVEIKDGTYLRRGPQWQKLDQYKIVDAIKQVLALLAEGEEEEFNLMEKADWDSDFASFYKEVLKPLEEHGRIKEGPSSFSGDVTEPLSGRLQGMDITTYVLS